MADQFKLKAFVRIDGTGKVIPGGPIFQASKPKVGKWREINVKECCNYVPGSTTTTTSTSTSTTTTTTTSGGSTQYLKAYWLNIGDACTTTTQGELTVYSSSPTFGPGISVFINPQLTIPVTEGYVLVTGMMNPNLVVGAGGVLGTYSCPSQINAAMGFVPVDVCASTVYGPLYYSGTLGNGTALYTDAALTLPYNPGLSGSYVKMYFEAADQVCTMSGNVIFSYLPC